MAKRPYGSGRLWSVKRKQGEVWYGSWWAGSVRVKRKIGARRSARANGGLTRVQAERELHRLMAERVAGR